MKNSPEWLKEWKEFSEAPKEKTKASLPGAFLKRASRDLCPHPAFVFFNLIGIHFITGTLSLLVCPQMGLGGISHHFSLMNLFMVFGNTACFFFCGAFFVSTSLFSAFFFLEKESIQMIAKKKWLFLPGMLGLSFISLKMFALNLSLESSEFFKQDLPWIIGAFVIGLLIIKTQESNGHDLQDTPSLKVR